MEDQEALLIAHGDGRGACRRVELEAPRRRGQVLFEESSAAAGHLWTEHDAEPVDGISAQQRADNAATCQHDDVTACLFVEPRDDDG